MQNKGKHIRNNYQVCILGCQCILIWSICFLWVRIDCWHFMYTQT